MSKVETSTNPQVTHDDSTTSHESGEQKIDHVAGDMAAKASKLQRHSEKESDIVGGVSSDSGGIFTK